MRGTNFKMLYLGVNMFISVHFALCFTQLLLLLLLHHIDARPINLNARPSAFLEPLSPSAFLAVLFHHWRVANQKISNATHQEVFFLTTNISQLGVYFPQQKLQSSELLVSSSAATLPFISAKDKASKIVIGGTMDFS